MAHIEVNAMSVKLSSTFEAEIFFPGMNLEGEKKYPVIWFVHPDGTGPVELEKYTEVLERFAEAHKVFIIAPDISHSLCTDMVWGTYNEQFIAEECPRIFQFMYPLSTKKEDNYLLGIGSGAYGAIKVATHHKNRFGTVISVNGELDLAEKIRNPDNSETFIYQTMDSLDALFGDRYKVAGSEADLYSDACGVPDRLYMSCSTRAKGYKDNRKYADYNKNVEIMFSDDNPDFYGVCTLLKKTLDMALGDK